MIEGTFENNKQFLHVSNASFKNALNECSVTPIKLANYIDLQIKNGSMQRENAVIDYGIDDFIRLLHLIDSVDLFVKVYEKQLTMRLLDKKSLSFEAETILVQKLKTVFGIRGIKKLECVLRDREESDILTKEFKSTR